MHDRCIGCAPGEEQTQLQNSYAEKDLGVWWTPSWTRVSNVPLLLRRLMTFLAALGKVWPAGQERRSFPSSQNWWGCTWSAVSSFGPPSTRGTWIYWIESSGGAPWWWTGAHLLWREDERAGNVQPWDESAQGNLINSYKYLTGECKEESQLFSVVHSAQTRGRGHKHSRFHLNIGSTSLLWG